MRKLIAAFKISLDGKIAGSEGMAGWVEAWSEDYGLTDEIDACLIGGGMYPGYEAYWTGLRDNPTTPAWITGLPPTAAELEWAKFAAKTPHYVVSRTLTTAQWPQTRFVRELEDVADLKQQAGKNIYLMGGAAITGSLLDAGLVDEFRLLVYPLIAGDGLALFKSNAERRGLQLCDVRQQHGGMVRLSYGVRGELDTK